MAALLGIYLISLSLWKGAKRPPGVLSARRVGLARQRNGVGPGRREDSTGFAVCFQGEPFIFRDQCTPLSLLCCERCCDLPSFSCR